jgi:hypothetical protein
MEIDGRSEKDMCTLSYGFGTEEVTDLAEQLGVPRGAERDPCWHSDAGGSPGAVAFAANTGRSIGHLQLWYSGLGKRLGSPVGLASDKAALVGERKNGERGIDIDHIVDDVTSAPRIDPATRHGIVVRRGLRWLAPCMSWHRNRCRCDLFRADRANINHPTREIS